jgi:integrase
MASKTNCVINGKPYYRIRKKIGVDADGKKIIKSFYGKNKTDAENQVKEWEENHNAGINKDENFSVLMNYYVTKVFEKGNHAAGSKIRYKGVYEKYIKKSELNEYRMNEISGQVIQGFFNSLKATYSTLIAIRNILTLFFQYAEMQGYCRNPMNVIKISRDRIKHKEIVTFSKEEVKKIVSSEKTRYHSYNRFLILFALGTGLREGEILGLKFGDIVNGQVKVLRQAVTGTDKKRSIADTKTGNSIRYIPIPKPLLAELEELKEGKNDEDHIFTSRYGNLMDVNNLTRSYKRFLKSIDVPYKDFHTLRRTYATTLCENGVDINTIAKLLGNTVAVVAQYYAFVSDKLKSDAVDKIEGMFN